jgi:replicative DNA helicase
MSTSASLIFKDESFAPSDVLFEPKRPPCSLESESAILSGLMLQNDRYDFVSPIIKQQDFYSPANGLIYSAIQSLLTKGHQADTVTVYEHLKEKNQDIDVGGLAYLNEIAQFVPSASNIVRYAEIVLDKSQLRSLNKVASSISTKAFSPGERSAADLISEAQEDVFKLSNSNARMGTDKLIEQSMMELTVKLQQMYDNPAAHQGLKTNFYDFDRLTNGLRPGQLVVLAARPSMGKSALAINIAEHVAINEKKPVIVFSLEMSNEELATRVLSSVARVPAKELVSGQLADSSWPRVIEALEKVKDAPLKTDDAAGVTVSEIRSRARRFTREFKNKVSLVIVDHIHIVAEAGNSNDNKAARMGDISSALKIMAKELGCPVIALAQLNRKVEERVDKRPLMSDLRESGAIEQDADIIAFLYRDEYYTKEACKEPGVAEIIIAKNRQGATGTVRLGFEAEITQFYNLARSES